jgi:Protein kinase domain
MMLLDDDIIIISDGKPLITNENDEGSGDKTIGSYSMGEALGSGGFGEVCVGVNRITGERVALKFIEKSSIQSFMDAERTALEHRVLSSLNHRSIIKLISVSAFLSAYTNMSVGEKTLQIDISTVSDFGTMIYTLNITTCARNCLSIHPSDSRHRSTSLWPLSSWTGVICATICCPGEIPQQIPRCQRTKRGASSRKSWKGSATRMRTMCFIET